MTLRVTLEIVPFGDEEKKYVIETINISNIGSHDGSIYAYSVEHNTYKQRTTDTPRVLHKRSDGAIALAVRALQRVLNTK